MSAPDYGQLPPQHMPPARASSSPWKWILLALAMALVFFIWQCGSAFKAAMSESDGSVAEFHRALNAGDFARIYEEAHPDFKKSTQQAELEKLLEAIHRKLGEAGKSDRQNLVMNATTSGRFVTGVYSTQYAAEKATETFVWKADGKKLRLFNYTMNARALITD